MSTPTQADLVELWRRDMDPGYTQPLEDENAGAGLDPIAGVAAVLARAAEAGNTSTQALYLLPHRIQTAPPASGSATATGTVKVYRRTLVGPELPLDDGDPILAYRRGVDGEDVFGPLFEVVGDITIPAGVEGPTTVNVRCSRPGFPGNVRAGLEGRIPELRGGSFDVVSFVPGTGVVTVDATLGDTFQPPMVGMWWRFTDGLNVGVARRIAQVLTTTTAVIDAASTLIAHGAGLGEVVNVTDVAELYIVFDGTSGGRSAELDALARERGAPPRTIGEDDASFRLRAATLPEAISPNAIIRAVTKTLEPEGIPFLYVEVFDDDAGCFFSGGATITDDAFDDPYAFRRKSFFVGSRPGMVPIGFLIVINGLAVPPEPDRTRILANLTETLVAIKGPGVPWAIAFEPPIP